MIGLQKYRIQNNAFYAFGHKVNRFIDYQFGFHAHVFGTDIDNKTLFCNDYQKVFCKTFCNFDFVVNKSLKEIYPQKYFNTLITNNNGILHTKQTKLCIESMPSAKKFLSIKTLLFNSANNISGVFGFAFPLNFCNISLNNVISILNDFSLFSEVSTVAYKVVKNTFPSFTLREKDIAYYLIRGYTMKGIARVLDISPRTVEKYLVKMKAKLGCYTKTQLISKLLDEYLSV